MNTHPSRTNGLSAFAVSGVGRLAGQAKCFF
jgi:hypothetical protein